MDNSRFALLEQDLNREFGRKKKWHRYFENFQRWLEQAIEQGSERLRHKR